MRKIGLVILMAGAIVSSGAVLGLKELKWFSFNREDALKEWKEKIFQGRVLYTVKPRDPTGYLIGKSRKASSGLYYLIKFNFFPCQHNLLKRYLYNTFLLYPVRESSWL